MRSQRRDSLNVEGAVFYGAPNFSGKVRRFALVVLLGVWDLAALYPQGLIRSALLWIIMISWLLWEGSS